MPVNKKGSSRCMEAVLAGLKCFPGQDNAFPGKIMTFRHARPDAGLYVDNRRAPSAYVCGGAKERRQILDSFDQKPNLGAGGCGAYLHPTIDNLVYGGINGNC
jgi:hypothetical protein